MILPRLTTLLVFTAVVAVVGVGCKKNAPSSSSSSSSPSPSSSSSSSSSFLASGYGQAIAVEIEDGNDARILKLTGDTHAFKLKGPGGALILDATAGKHGKVAYVHENGSRYQVRDSDDDPNRFKIKSDGGDTLLKIKRTDGKLKIQQGEDGPDVLIIKGDADKMKLIVPPEEKERAAVKKAESGKFKVKAPDDTVLFKGDGPVPSAAYLLPVLKGAPPVDAGLYDVLFCELLRRGW